MHVLSAVDLASLLDVVVGRERFLYEAAQLLFVGRMPFHGFDNQAMCRPTGFLGEGLSALPAIWGVGEWSWSLPS